MTKRVKGVVMEEQGAYAVLLTADGRFVRVRPLNPAVVGTEIVGRLAPRRSAQWPRLAVAAALLLALVVPTLMFWPGGNVYAYVSVDGPAGVTMAISAEGQVVGVTADDARGRQVLGNLQLQGKPVDEALAALTTAEAKRGWLTPGQRVELVLVVAPAKGNTLNVAVQTKLRQGQARALAVVAAQKAEGKVAEIEVDAAASAAAKAQGLSLGKYVILHQLQEQHVNVDVTKAKGVSLHEVLQGEQGVTETELDQAVKALTGEPGDKSPDKVKAGEQGQDRSQTSKEKNDKGSNADKGQVRAQDHAAGQQGALERLQRWLGLGHGDEEKSKNKDQSKEQNKDKSKQEQSTQDNSDDH